VVALFASPPPHHAASSSPFASVSSAAVRGAVMEMKMQRVAQTPMSLASIMSVVVAFLLLLYVVPPHWRRSASVSYAALCEVVMEMKMHEAMQAPMTHASIKSAATVAFTSPLICHFQ
jgi:hypothetical protein